MEKSATITTFDGLTFPKLRYSADTDRQISALPSVRNLIHRVEGSFTIEFYATPRPGREPRSQYDFRAVLSDRFGQAVSLNVIDLPVLAKAIAEAQSKMIDFQNKKQLERIEEERRQLKSATKGSSTHKGSTFTDKVKRD